MMFENKYKSMYESMDTDKFVKEAKYIYSSLERKRNFFMVPLGIVLLYHLWMGFLNGLFLGDVFQLIISVGALVGYCAMVNSKKWGALVVGIFFLIDFIFFYLSELMKLLDCVSVVCLVVASFFMLRMIDLSVYLDTARRLSNQKIKEELDIELKF